MEDKLLCDKWVNAVNIDLLQQDIHEKWQIVTKKGFLKLITVLFVVVS